MKNMNALEKRNVADEAIISRYHQLLRQCDISFNSICFSMFLIFAGVSYFTNHLLVGALAATVIGLFLMLGHFIYFLFDLAEQEGLYNSVTNTKGYSKR